MARSHINPEFIKAVNNEVAVNNNFVIYHYFKNHEGEERSTKLEIKITHNQPNIYIHNGRRPDGNKIYARFGLTKENVRKLIAELEKYK